MIHDAAVPPTPSGVDANAWLAAITAIRGYCGWHIAPSLPETVHVTGAGGGALFLPSVYVTAVASVTNHETAIEGFQWSEKGIVRGAYWVNRLGGVHVTFTHGYANFPADIIAVAKSMAQQGDGAPGGRLTSGPHSVELSEHAQAGAASMSKMHKAVLDRYRVRPEL